MNYLDGAEFAQVAELIPPTASVPGLGGRFAGDAAHIEEIQLMQNWDASVDGVDALQLAAANGAVTCLELMLEAGADPERFTGGARRTALMMAAQHGCAECVVVLIGAGANPNHFDRTGRSAFDLAAAARQSAADDAHRAGLDAVLEVLKAYQLSG